MRKRVLVVAICLLCALAALWWRLQAVRAQTPSGNLTSGVVDAAGPVVGFERIQVGTGPQWIEPTVRPFTPLPNSTETTAQMLTSYLGDSFMCAVNASAADWVGCGSDEDNTNLVTLIWRGNQGQWYNLDGNPVTPDCTDASGLWLNLAFDSSGLTNSPTRELVLSGEVVWLGEAQP